MNRYLYIIIFLLLSHRGLSTGQTGELIIYQSDTLELLSTPLTPYLSNDTSFYEKIPALKYGCSTALWRGYVGLWKIDKDKLYLIDIFTCGDKEKSLKSTLFPYSSGAIMATWFSGELIIPKGKMLQYFHTGFARIYEKNINLSIKSCNVVDTKIYKNGYLLEDPGLSREPSEINRLLYENIAWENISKLSKRTETHVSFCVGETGSKEKISIDSSFIYYSELKAALDSLNRFKVLYWNGNGYPTCYIQPIVFSRKNRRRYAR